MSGYDSIQVRFKNVKEWPSLLANTRTVPFINSYFDVIKSCIDDIRTEYFWIFASFLKLDTFDFDFIPFYALFSYAILILFILGTFSIGKSRKSGFRDPL